MRLTRAIGVVGLSCGLGFGCAASGSYRAQTYIVQPQDTLYSIAWRYDLDYRELARWNNIGPDYRIAVGQVLLLKSVGGAPVPRPPLNVVPAPRDAPRDVPRDVSRDAAHDVPRDAAHDVPRVTAPRQLNAPPGVAAAPAPVSSTTTPKPGVVSGISQSWVWPTQRASEPRSVPGGGILLLGQLGQPVRAACAGRVVYVGSGLRAYGNLIIIKHGDNLLTAYAHTRELLVREGQDVAGGQDIARMGLGPHQVAALYFEIRLNGKPVDPLRYLSTVR